ncbi:MAG TPA: hypothetical protein PKY30_05295 [Myxococcota bacterium]|nr:hypothetical protein [Myxococcota bacterium]HNH46427.1 hypothetical protein [Myxococcota bacterium]
MFRLLPLLLVACEAGKIQLGGGPEPDARFWADVFTWQCSATVDDVVQTWEGAFNYDLRFQYAPDALTEMESPDSGCNFGADLFPDNAGDGGVNLSGSPGWYNSDALTGTMEAKGDGFYFDSAFSNQRTCTYVDELIGDGTELTDAGSFSGAKTPVPGSLDSVTITGVDSETGIQFGADVTVEWEAENWEKSWVQIRREQGGALVEAATCATTGDSSFDVDSDVWDLLHDAVEVDVTNVYVGMEKHDSLTAEDGQEIELITRVMHIAVIQD